MIQQLINDEKFTNIQKAQSGLARLFADADKSLSFYTVLRNDEPLGVLIPRKRWLSLVEDLEALSSTSYRQRIAQSRKGKRVSADEVKETLGL